MSFFYRFLIFCWYVVVIGIAFRSGRTLMRFKGRPQYICTIQAKSVWKGTIRINYFSFQSLEQPLVVYTLCFQETQLQLLSVSAQLSGKPVSLRLKFPLTNTLIFEIFKGVLQILNLTVAILVVTNQLVKVDLFLGDCRSTFMSLGFALSSIALKFIGNEYHLITVLFIFFVRLVRIFFL